MSPLEQYCWTNLVAIYNWSRRGHAIREIAPLFGMEVDMLYRYLCQLERQGAVRYVADSGGWVPL